MSTSTVSNPELSTSSYGNSSTPWGWLVWNEPNATVAIPLWSTEREHVATIGRGLLCTVPVPPTLVANSFFQRISRHHCTLQSASEHMQTLLINNSPNGTFVNGERVDYLRTLPIDHGDVVALCSADSEASFTFYDNHYRYLGYHLDLSNKYLIMNIVASGAYSEVCRGIVKSNNTIVAIKIVPRSNRRAPYSSVAVNTRAVKALGNEISILSTTEHPCIVKMVDSSFDVNTSRIFLALELANGGDLQQRLHDVGHLSEPVSRFIFVQLVSAIKYCHGRSPPIVHRDLSPANILLVNADEFARVKTLKQALRLRHQPQQGCHQCRCGLL
ncbi:probable serine/threonine-protein kinase fhkD [Daphnia pulicaria]|uniref:probable serine/threonine-protein kinase fhkD n=1 Tax=Daphnia pulicaria TaxID=35523 RepID=UPI001EEA967C|nr:probable serine/threonine-protein kinase fhkD [Daphnia pulicaria]